MHFPFFLLLFSRRLLSITGFFTLFSQKVYEFFVDK